MPSSVAMSKLKVTGVGGASSLLLQLSASATDTAAMRSRREVAKARLLLPRHARVVNAAVFEPRRAKDAVELAPEPASGASGAD